jgi:hypothetical protein
MASSGGPFYTAGQVCEMLTDDDGDMEYIFPGVTMTSALETCKKSTTE